MRRVEQQATHAREEAQRLQKKSRSLDSWQRLSEVERAVVLFENQWRPSQGRRKDEIKHRFGFGLTTFLTHLDRAIIKPEAEDLAPSVVNRRRAAIAQRYERASQQTLATKG